LAIRIGCCTPLAAASADARWPLPRRSISKKSIFQNELGYLVQGFKNFLLRGNLVELAVAVVIGTAFGAVVTALVNDFITPLIAAIGGKPDFSSLYFTVNHSKFSYGAFVNALLSFIIIAAVVYFFVVAPVVKLLSLVQRKAAATERDCPECLSSIPVNATRCKFCTATVTPAAPPAAPA
jgi:large conductance mechanosensitive channel